MKLLTVARHGLTAVVLYAETALCRYAPMPPEMFILACMYLLPHRGRAHRLLSSGASNICDGGEMLTVTLKHQSVRNYLFATPDGK